MSRNIRFVKSESARKKITKQQIKGIKKLYSNLGKKMEKKVEMLAFKSTYSAGIQRLMLNDFVEELKKEMENVNSLAMNICKDGSKKVANEIVKENSKLLKNLGIKIDAAFQYVPTKAVTQIINGNVYNGRWTLSKSIWGTNKKNKKDIERIVAEGLAGNKPVKEISKELVGYSKSGKAMYNAVRLARTMSNHAYQKALQMTTETNPFITAYQWNNGSHGNICPICQDLATRDAYDLGPGVFPKDEVPLDHPNGFCYITCIVLDRDEVDKALFDWVNDTGDNEMNNLLDKFSRDMGYEPVNVKKYVK